MGNGSSLRVLEAQLCRKNARFNHPTRMIDLSYFQPAPFANYRLPQRRIYLLLQTIAHPTFHRRRTKLFRGSEAQWISVDPIHPWGGCTTRVWLSLVFAAPSPDRLPRPSLPFSWGGTRLARFLLDSQLLRQKNTGSKTLLLGASTTAVAPEVI